MVSMMAIFVALVLNRISTPFQRMFYVQSTVKEQQKEEVTKALQLLGMIVVAVYGVTGNINILGIDGVTIVQTVLAIAIGVGFAQVLEIVSVSHLRPILEGQEKPNNVYDRWIWDTIFISELLVSHVRYELDFSYMVLAWLLYTVIPYAVTRYNISHNIDFGVGIKAYKWGTMIWMLASLVYIFVL
jgi:hypothetical protein